MLATREAVVQQAGPESWPWEALAWSPGTYQVLIKCCFCQLAVASSDIHLLTFSHMHLMLKQLNPLVSFMHALTVCSLLISPSVRPAGQPASQPAIQLS